MSIRDSRSIRALVLAAALALAALPARALPLDGTSRLGDRGAFASFFETLRSLWLGVWGEEGVTIDPDGRPKPGMTNVLGNEGMTIDPDGRPTGNATNPGELTDEGTSIDPHG